MAHVHLAALVVITCMTLAAASQCSGPCPCFLQPPCALDGFSSTLNDGTCGDRGKLSDCCNGCTPGWYCPDRRVRCQCDPGHYQDFPFAKSCKLCPAGHYNTQAGQSGCPSCTLGTYCPEGTVNPSQCQMGSYCRNPSTITLCPAGYYGAQAVLTVSTCSGPCNIPGTYCPPGTTDNQNPCPAGFYCSTSVTPVVCPKANYCPLRSSRPTLCPPGSYGTSEGLQTSVCTALCPPGRFGASPGLTAPECSGLCAAGFYGSDPGRTSSACNGNCPHGSFCPAGSTSSSTQCAVGSFCATPATQLPCRAGYFGNRPGLTEPTCSGQCTIKGTYCPAGSTTDQNACPAGSCCATAAEIAQCTIGNYCPLRSVAPTPCQLGRFGASQGLSLAACSGPCAPGFYGSKEGLSTSQCSGPCLAGYFGASTGLTTATCSAECPAGTFCIAGSIAPTNCSAGRFGKQPRLTTAECSGFCDKGYWCSARSTSAKQFPCAGGFFGDSVGQTKSTCTKACDGGFFCPPASVAQTPCPAGRFCPPQSAQPSSCPQRSYCPARSAAAIPCGFKHVTSPPNSVSASNCSCEKGFTGPRSNCSGWFEWRGVPVRMLAPRGLFSRLSSVNITLVLSGPTDADVRVTLKPPPSVKVRGSNTIVVSAGKTSVIITLDSVKPSSDNETFDQAVSISDDSAFHSQKLQSFAVRVLPVSGCNLDERPCNNNGQCDPWSGKCTCFGGMFTDAVCSACAPGYYSASSKCVPCVHSSGAAFGLFLLSLLVTSGVFILLNYTPRFRSLLVPILTALYTVQIISLLGLVDTQWTPSLQFIIGTSSLANFLLWEVATCSVNILDRMMLSLFFPLFIAAGFVLAYLVFERRHATEIAKTVKMKYLLIRSFLTILAVLYTYLLRQSAGALAHVVVDREWRHPQDWRLAWDSSSWIAMRVFGGLGLLVFGLGIPALLVFMMWRKWNSVDACNLACGWLVRSFEKHAILWEPCGSCVFRAIAVLAAVYVPFSGPLFGIVVVTAVALTASFTLRPFRNPINNLQHQGVLAASLVAMVCFFHFYSATPTAHRDDSIGVVFLHGITFVLLYLAVAAIVVITAYACRSIWRQSITTPAKIEPRRTVSVGGAPVDSALIPSFSFGAAATAGLPKSRTTASLATVNLASASGSGGQDPAQLRFLEGGGDADAQGLSDDDQAIMSLVRVPSHVEATLGAGNLQTPLLDRIMDEQEEDEDDLAISRISLPSRSHAGDSYAEHSQHDSQHSQPSSRTVSLLQPERHSQASSDGDASTGDHEEPS